MDSSHLLSSLAVCSANPSVCTSSSTGRSSQAGSAQGAGLPPGGFITRTDPHPTCPSLLPSFSPTSLCKVHTPSLPFLFQRVISSCLQVCTFTSQVWRGQGWGPQPSTPHAQVAEAMRCCWKSLSSSCSPSAARTSHTSTAQKALSAPREDSQEFLTITA